MKSFDIRLVLPLLPLIAVAGAAGQTTRKSVSADEVTGTFRMNFTGKYRKQSNDIKIASIGQGKVRVAMDLIYPYTMQNGELMVNMGQLDDEFAISGDQASFTSEDGRCSMTIRFVRPGTITVRQDGSDADCGFGHNVVASGTYRKISTKKPEFESSVNE